MNKCKLCGSNPITVYRYEGSHKRNPGTGCTNEHCPMYETELSEDEWEKLNSVISKKSDAIIQIIKGLKREDGWKIVLVGSGETYTLPKYAFEWEAKQDARIMSCIMGSLPIIHYEESIVMNEATTW